MFNGLVFVFVDGFWFGRLELWDLFELCLLLVVVRWVMELVKVGLKKKSFDW